MINKIESVLLSSENAGKLAKFYQEKIGLKLASEMEMGEKGEKGFEFDFGNGSNLYVIDHSKVKGNSHQPERVLLNLEVDNIEDEAKRLKDAKVKVVEDIYHIQGYGLIATFEDTDGNYFQLVQVRPS
jgi:predicted enzyme related to lactoylglutathione lyase